MKAFPNHRSEGMDLRDYFAAKAMQTLLAHDPKNCARLLVERSPYDEMEIGIVAEGAYHIADVMMKERENNG